MQLVNIRSSYRYEIDFGIGMMMVKSATITNTLKQWALLCNWFARKQKNLKEIRQKTMDGFHLCIWLCSPQLAKIFEYHYWFFCPSFKLNYITDEYMHMDDDFSKYSLMRSWSVRTVCLQILELPIMQLSHSNSCNHSNRNLILYKLYRASSF